MAVVTKGDPPSWFGLQCDRCPHEWRDDEHNAWVRYYGVAGESFPDVVACAVAHDWLLAEGCILCPWHRVTVEGD